MNQYANPSSVAVTSNVDSPIKYQLQTNYNSTGVSVGTGADVVLYTYSGEGLIDYVGVANATSSNYEVAIFVDSVERFRITMSALGSDLGQTAVGSIVWADTANKNFRYVPNGAVGFKTDFSIKGKSTTGTQTLKHIVLFRSRVT